MCRLMAGYLCDVCAECGEREGLRPLLGLCNVKRCKTLVKRASVVFCGDNRQPLPHGYELLAPRFETGKNDASSKLQRDAENLLSQFFWGYVSHAIALLGLDRTKAIELVKSTNPCSCRPKCTEQGNTGKHMLINLEGVEALLAVAGKVNYDQIMAKKVALAPHSAQANARLATYREHAKKLWALDLKWGHDGLPLADPKSVDFDRITERAFNELLKTQGGQRS